MGNKTFEPVSAPGAGLARGTSHREESRDPAWSLCEPQLALFSSCGEPMACRDLSPHGLFHPSYVSSAALSHLALAAHLFKRAKRAVAPHAACESNPACATTRALASSAQWEQYDKR